MKQIPHPPFKLSTLTIAIQNASVILRSNNDVRVWQAWWKYQEQPKKG